ncbi:MAG: class I SAM-dependent methyltransferase [Symploca sp. SIO2E6]|nr:class I SAM-dependent methyltransferase [Symploca sp. SIO2E6]
MGYNELGLIHQYSGSSMEVFDYDKIRYVLLKGPRVTSLLKHFENIAAGISQVPKQSVYAASDFLSKSNEYREYHSLFQRNIGTFYQHLCASIPFFIEEQCRIGIALQRLAKHRLKDEKYPFTYYETSAADGTNARTMSEYSQGMIRTLTDSPNTANVENFHRLCQHGYSDIYIGSFVDITPEYISVRNDRPYFKEGFDIIYENTTFQMYNPNRKEQIAYVKRVLKSDGLIIFCEKLMHPIRDEYERRENIKDSLFKSHYFTKADIDHKISQILEEMEQCQVTLDELVDSISYHFKYAYMIWNSTNFYEIVASNDRTNLQNFIDCLGDYYVPVPFLCEESLGKPLL